MANYNSVFLIGHLGKDPEMRSMPNGDAVTGFSLAITEKWKNNGEMNERTLWMDVSCFKRAAEFVGKYLKKGSSVMVAGRLQEDRWEDKEGNKHSKIKVIAHRIEALTKKEKTEDTKESEEVPF